MTAWVEDFARGPDLVEPEEQPTVVQLLHLIEHMQRDWVVLNEILNATARYYSWCGDWEERVRRYNDQFNVLKLEGRTERNYTQGQGHNPDPYLLPQFVKRKPVDHKAEEAMRAKAAEITKRINEQRNAELIVERDRQEREMRAAGGVVNTAMTTLRDGIRALTWAPAQTTPDPTVADDDDDDEFDEDEVDDDVADPVNATAVPWARTLSPEEQRLLTEHMRSVSSSMPAARLTQYRRGGSRSQ